jgi:hypothetical protein
MIKMINKLYSLLGIVISLWHLYLGSMSIFLFRNNEPWTSWLVMISGPLLTLPMFLIGFKRPRISSWGLFCGASLSLFLMTISKDVSGDSVPVLNYALMVSVPMYLLAIMCLLREKA